MSFIAIRGAQDILSNFYASKHKLRYAGLSFKTLEHAYQYKKAKEHGDDKLADEIFVCDKAIKAKVLGSSVSVSQHWHSVKAYIMQDLLRCKAECIPEFRQMLLSTHNAKLTHPVKDDFWGYWDGQGMDMFGHLLMELRDNLKAEWG